VTGGERQEAAINAGPDSVVMHLIDEAVRGFLFEKHVPLDTADEWTEEIVAIVREHLEVARG